MLEPRHTNVGTDPRAVAGPDDLSLFRGGPFYRPQLKTHLLESDSWHLPRRVALILAVSWLPLVILTALFQRQEVLRLLKDYLVYSRIAIAIPVLLIGHILLEERFREMVLHVRATKVISVEDQQKLAGVLVVLRRLRDSLLPELLLVALVFAELVLISKSKLGTGPAWAVDRTSGVLRLTPAGWYYGLVSVPIYQFLIFLSFWKWLLWAFFLFRLSRMNLKLVATHPDGHGGLGFLGLSPIGFCPVAVALSTAIGGAWRSEILNYGARLVDFRLATVILFALIFMVALGPLTLFVSKLSTLRRKAMLEYGILAQTQVTDFHEKWVSLHEGKKEAPCDASDVGALADLTISYHHIKRMRPFPVDLGTMVSLAAAVLLPLFPAVLAEIPLSVILQGLVQAVKAVPI